MRNVHRALVLVLGPEHHRRHVAPAAAAVLFPIIRDSFRSHRRVDHAVAKVASLNTHARRVEDRELNIDHAK